MRPIEQWIWFPKDTYPEYQTSEYNMLVTESTGPHKYAVAALNRNYQTGKAIKEIGRAHV